MLNVDDPKQAVAELQRCRQRGLVGALITVRPPDWQPFRSDVFEDLWAAAVDLEMPLSLHVATDRADPRADEYRLSVQEVPPSVFINKDYQIRGALCDLIFSKVFDSWVWTRRAEAHYGRAQLPARDSRRLHHLRRDLAADDLAGPRVAQKLRASCRLLAGVLPPDYTFRGHLTFRTRLCRSIVSTAPLLQLRSQQEVSMPKKSFVVRSHADGWMVQREGKKSPESTHRKKDVAVRKGRSLAKRAGGVLKIKGKERQDPGQAEATRPRSSPSSSRHPPDGDRRTRPAGSPEAGDPPAFV